MRAGMPAEWRVGEKIGTAGNEANDVGFFVLPPQRAQLIVAAYLAESATDGARDKALSSVGRLMART